MASELFSHFHGEHLDVIDADTGELLNHMRCNIVIAKIKTTRKLYIEDELDALAEQVCKKLNKEIKCTDHKWTSKEYMIFLRKDGQILAKSTALGLNHRAIADDHRLTSCNG